MAKQTIQIADKPTEDEILALLKSSEIGLAVLKELLGHSADAETMEAIKALLENGTYGLNAIKSAISGRANESTSTAIKALLENTTYGLNAIKSAVNGRANETTSAAIKSLLENGTYGLNALKNAITNSSKYNNVSSSILQASGTVQKNGETSNFWRDVYSGTLSINGCGEILFLNPVLEFGDFQRYAYGYLTDIRIDGKTLGGGNYQHLVWRVENGNQNIEKLFQFRFKFASSFSCRLQVRSLISSVVDNTTKITLSGRMEYLAQTR